MAEIRGLSGGALEERYVPAGKRWVVRDIDAYASIVAGSGVQLVIASRLQDQTFCYMEWIALERASKHWEGRQVINYAEGLGAIRIQNFGAEAVDVTISGYELEDPDALGPG
jgi:hypothetical protein